MQLLYIERKQCHRGDHRKLQEEGYAEQRRQLRHLGQLLEALKYGNLRHLCSFGPVEFLFDEK
ncbi:hypothetical protein D3C81_2240390 [compost metagenome]